MAQTCQMIKPQVSQTSWVQTFPASTQSSTDSLMFMKKLLAISISNILYLRGVFPELYFVERCINNLNIKVLSEECESQGPLEVIKWIRGCYHALENCYLRQASIGIYTSREESSKMIEVYTFQFSYEKESASLSVNGSNTIIPLKITDEVSRDSTLSLLGSILRVTKSLSPLPNLSFLTMKLLYYDEVTPPKYEPPGFMTCNSTAFSFGTNPVKLDLGKVATDFHSVNVKLKTTAVPGIDANNNTEPSSHSQPTSTDPKDTNENEAQETGFSPRNKKDDVGKENLPENKENVSMDETTSDDDEGIVCPCGDLSNDGLMINCEKCKKWQHGICFAVLEEENAPNFHICHLCDDNDNFVCYDRLMMKLNPTQRSELAIFRRTLNFCETTTKKYMTATELMKKLDVERAVAHKIMQKLEANKFMSTAKGKYRGRKIILKDYIREEGYRTYFDVNIDVGKTSVCTDSSIFDGSQSSKNKSSPSSSANQDLESLTSQTESLGFVTKKRKRGNNTSIIDEDEDIFGSGPSQKKQKCSVVQNRHSKM